MLDEHYKYINDLVSKIQSTPHAAYSLADDNIELNLALGELVSFYQPLIQASVRRCMSRECKLRNHAEDMQSEAVLVMLELVKQYDPTLSYFSYFVSTRIDQALLSRAKKLWLANNGTIDEVPFSAMPRYWQEEAENHCGQQSDPFGDIERRNVIQGAIAQLKDSHRDAIELYFFQEMTQEQAALYLGINQTSFCKRLQRAITSLRNLLGDTPLD